MLTIENAFTEYPDIVDVDEVMKILRIGKNKAYDLIHAGEIKSIKVGRAHKIPKQSIIDFINDKTVA